MNTLHYRVRAIFLGLAGLGALAQAQTVYRCGSNYSDTPCPQAVNVLTSDARTPAQKAQTDQATAKTAALAAQMEQTRRADEAAVNRQSQIQAKAAAQTEKAAQKAKADAMRTQARAKKQETQTAVIRLAKTNKAPSQPAKDPSPSGKQPATAGKAKP